jgi:hypothetical protein
VTVAYLIGTDNPHSTDPRRALEIDVAGSAGRRLFEMSKMSEEKYLRSFFRVNAIDGPEIPEGATAIVLGKLAWERMNLPSRADWFATVRHRGVEWILVPHPSGLNLMYNDEDNVTKLRGLLEYAASPKKRTTR